jgi:hypothetical protein
MHSAAWNETYVTCRTFQYLPLTLGGYDFRNKEVGVISGGSSSIQIVPSPQKLEGIKMTCFVRSKTWISNPFGEMSMRKLRLYPDIFECKSFLSNQLDKFITRDTSLRGAKTGV